MLCHTSATVILVINIQIQHSTLFHVYLWPLSCEPPVNSRKPGRKGLHSVDNRVLHITVHPTHIAVSFAVDSDAEGMDALPIGLAQRGLRILEGVLLLIVVVERPTIAQEHEETGLHLSPHQGGHRMSDRCTVAVLLPGTQPAQALCSGWTQSLIKTLDGQHIHRPASLAGIGIECVLVAHRLQRLTEQDEAVSFYVNHAAPAFELASGRSTHVYQQSDGNIAIFFFSPDVDPITFSSAAGVACNTVITPSKVTEKCVEMRSALAAIQRVP